MDVLTAKKRLEELAAELNKVIIGQRTVIEKIIVALVCEGHVLIEGVPGLAKTTIVKSIAKAIGGNYARVQFTPDLLPSDLIGTVIYDPKSNKFDVQLGPIFTNILLADEINRAPAKTQSALLEAMQEKQVTIFRNTYKLPKPFMVLATQNPIEQEGTYKLPEAQLDRFMLKVLISYPNLDDEKHIIDLALNNMDVSQKVSMVISIKELDEIKNILHTIYLDEDIKDYIVRLVNATRRPSEYSLKDIEKYIEFGASPRATIYLAQASRVYAILDGRDYVIPPDVNAILNEVLRHRIILSYEAEVEDISPEMIISRITSKVKP